MKSWLFCGASFLAAFLLFSVQPLFGKLYLPVLGGSPSVWNTCMAFYQAMLAAGYLLAHGTRWTGEKRWGAFFWVALFCAAGLAAFISFAAFLGTPGPQSIPALWLLGQLFLRLGVPLLVLSAAAPLLQSWYAGDGDDPYFLYVWSNAGSLAGLLSYPLLIERRWGLDEQLVLWRMGLALWLVLAAAAALLSRRARPAPAVEPVPAGLRLRWTVLAAVPAGLLMAATAYLSTDVSPVPLFWTIPLALYLATWMLAFSAKGPLFLVAARRGMPLAVVLASIFLATEALRPWGVVAAVHLAHLGVVALCCHGLLSASRPAPGGLTTFYLCLALGGALGGAAVAWLAPVLFSRTLEYPWLVAAAACLLPAASGGKGARGDAVAPFLLATGLAVVRIGAARFFDGAIVLAGLAAYLFSRRRWRFGLGIGVVLLAGLWRIDEAGRTVHVDRSFFGVNRVVEEREGNVRWLVHGNTIHGGQFRDPALRRIPLAYLHPKGPLGDLFRNWEGSRAAVVGLGVGGVTAYARAGQAWTFFEIDPAVRRIAEDPHFFTFLADAPCPVEVVLGDARVSLSRVPDGAFDLLVVDAFGSDAVPVHLISREAVALYQRKVGEEGLIAFHLSNKYLNLAPVLAGACRALGLKGVLRRDKSITERDMAEGRFPSPWAVLSRSPESLAALSLGEGWSSLEDEPEVHWTDKFSDLLSVMAWR